MMRKKFQTGKTPLFLGAFFCAASLCAQSARDMDFADKLNENQMYDYAEYFLRGLLNAKPDDPDRIRVQLMDTLLRQQKTDEGLKILESIPKNSENYYRAQSVLGTYYFLVRKDNKKALEYLMPVFDYVTKNGKAPADWKQFGAIVYNIFTKEGMTAENQKFLEWWQGSQDMDARTKTYTSCLVRLETVENSIQAEEDFIRNFDDTAAKLRADAEKSEKFKKAEAAVIAAKNAWNVAEQKKNPGEIQKTRKDFETVSADAKKEFSLDFAEYYDIKDMQKSRLTTIPMFVRRSTLNTDQLNQLKKGKPNDWATTLFNVMFDLENIQWGGQDMASAAAAAMSARGYCLLGQYEAGIKEVRKFSDLFNGCDELLAKEGKIETSPGADAQMWEGFCNLRMAESFEKQNKMSDAVKYYRRAFKSFGTLLKNYPKHRSGAKNYVQFLRIIEKLSALDPKIADKLAAEKDKVPVPETGAQEDEKLISALAEQNFKDKNYKKVVDELLPILRQKRSSTGVPELLNRLIIAMVSSGEDYPALALGAWMVEKFPASPYTSHALGNSGNIIWQKSAEVLKANSKDIEKARLIRDSAMDFYNIFMKVGIAETYASDIALRMSREYYNRANELGKKLNSQTDNELRTAMKKDWLTAYDKTVDEYNFIINNFGNKPERIDEAFTMIAECYVLTERYENAAKTYEKFCANGSENKPLLIKAKENIAETLFRVGSAHEKEARAIREEAAAIIIPNIPETPEKPQEPAAAAVPAPAAADKSAPAPAAAGTVPAAAPTAADAANAKAVEDYKKALAEYEETLKAIETAKAEAEVQTKKKNAREVVANEEENIARKFYRDAINHLNQLKKEWLAPNSELSKKYGDKEDVKRTIERADALMPWLYDGVGEKENAIAAFNVYIQGHEGAKDIPAYMMRVGMLYTECGKDAEAQKILSDLSAKFPNSPEGKNAKFFLARNLYQSGSYAKALPIFKEIFAGKLVENLSISNFRWIASNLAECAVPQYAAEAAEISLKASKELLTRLQKPDFKEWVGALKAIEFQNNKTAADEYCNIIEQKILLDAGNAALLLNNNQEAIDFFSKILKLDKNTGYFNQLYFARAEAYRKMKNYAEARKDLARIGSRAMTRSKDRAPNYNLYNKSQVLIGEIFLEENEPAKAFAMFTMVATPAFETETTTPVKSDDPKDDSWQYTEQAIYRTAYTAAKLGKAEKEKMVEKYKKYYPKGKYLTDLDHLPAPDAK